MSRTMVALCIASAAVVGAAQQPDNAGAHNGMDGLDPVVDRSL